jgi:proteasome accessory factor B
MTGEPLGEGDWQKEPDTKPERLLSLTLALLSNSVGLSKEELFRSVRGYSLAIEDGVKPDALNKMFERDKQSLRDMGVQVETFIRDSDMDDNTESRYFIPADTFVWPKGTSLTPNQLRLLELAAKVWARASFSAEASRAVMRLKALGMASEGLELAGFAPRILTNEPGILQLEEAARDRLEVTFEYRAPGRSVERRVVHPWQVRHVSGQWLLVCWDVERQDVRNFMLKRIVSRIKPTGEQFEAITQTQLEDAIERLRVFTSQNTAVISVAPGTEAWVHFEMDSHAHGGSTTYELNFMDVHLLAEQLRVFGATVTVHEPSELRDAIRSGLEKVANAHA